MDLLGVDYKQNKKMIRSLCSHYQGGGWCRYQYNTASIDELARYIVAKASNQRIYSHEELICSCNWSECKIWLKDLYDKKIKEMERINEQSAT